MAALVSPFSLGNHKFFNVYPIEWLRIHSPETKCEFCNFDWHVTLPHKEGTTFLAKNITSRVPKIGNTGTSETSTFLLYPQAPWAASAQLAEHFQAKNIPSQQKLSLQMLQESDSCICRFSMGNLLGKVLLMTEDAMQCSSPGMTGREQVGREGCPPLCCGSFQFVLSVQQLKQGGGKWRGENIP